MLDTTGAASDAGIVRFFGTLPLLLLTLPAGALVDRVDRRPVMVVAELARIAAVVSVVAALAFSALAFAQIVVVAVVLGTGLVFFEVAQRPALRQIVPDAQLSEALARYTVRENVGLIGGQSLGGLLYGLGRALPWIADTISYIVSVATVVLVRTSLAPDRDTARRRLDREIADGFVWLWRQPFVRDTALLVTGSDLVLNALYLVLIVAGQRSGFSSFDIGLMLAASGVAGLAGSAVAATIARRWRARVIAIGTLAVPAVLVPLTALPLGPLALGVAWGAMFFLHPAWLATIGAAQMRQTPSALQGRLASALFLLSVGSVPLASLAVGYLLDGVGAVWTVLLLEAVMLTTLGCAIASPNLRAPRA